MISATEYRNVLIILSQINTAFIDSLSPQFKSLFASEKELSEFLTKLGEAARSNTIKSQFKDELIMLYCKKMQPLLEFINQRNQQFAPNLNEIGAFKKLGCDEYTFLKVVYYSLFMFCMSVAAEPRDIIN